MSSYERIFRMNTYYGFDLGDAESAIARLDHEQQPSPAMIPVDGAKSFITACARSTSGELIIGESACYTSDAQMLKIRFKSRFLQDTEAAADVSAFAKGVIRAIRDAQEPVDEDNCLFYVGCPAGWDKNTRERYRFIFEKTGYPPVKIVSESRAALVNACQSKYLQVGYDILSKPVLVVDIGSSTTDFAYIAEGHEVELKTGGEVRLGGGIMDEQLMTRCLSQSRNKEQLSAFFETHPAWKNYCEFAARRLKEQYFEDEAYWSEHECSRTVLIRSGKTLKFTLQVDAAAAQALLYGAATQLDGRSFHDVFTESLRHVAGSIDGPAPELLFLTGGVSKLSAVRDWCSAVFPDSVIVTGTEPEYSVAKGLAFCGRIDEQIRAFKADVQDLISSPVIENIVDMRLAELYEAAAEAIVGPILSEAALPVFDRWRDGQIRRLCDVDDELQKSITAFLSSEEARDYLHEPVAKWLGTVSSDLEQYTLPICVRHHVPHSALTLQTYLSSEDIDIHLEAKDIFAVGELTWLIDAIISILVGLLCGGSGIALLSSGLPGIAGGAVISLLVLLLGKGKMEKVLLKMDIPGPARHLIPRSAFSNRMETLRDEVKISFCESLLNEKNSEITKRMAGDISGQIETCLIRMAEVVEIPLGK